MNKELHFGDLWSMAVEFTDITIKSPDEETNLGKPLLFVEDAAGGRGVGYFRTNANTITAYRKYNTGYSSLPFAVYKRKDIETLYKLFQA